jgi:pentose-5-phosphate-3-epimerase
MALDVTKGFVDKWMLPNCTKKIKDGRRFFQQDGVLTITVDYGIRKLVGMELRGDGMSGVGTRSVTSYLFTQLVGH